MLTKIAIYARTLRHLRAVQWLYLPLRRAQARIGSSPAPVGDVHVASDQLEAVLADLGVDMPEQVAVRAEQVLRGQFTFLGHTETLAAIDWRSRYVSHLWNYNLHYFDYARSLAWAYRQTGEERFADAFSRLAQSWIRGTDPGRGDGWEPYAVSLRVVNWVHALVILGDALSGIPRSEIERSLARQVTWLERRLEHHIQANHLQKNFQALAVAGFYFAGRDADRWRRRGLRGSWSSAVEHVLSDGGHYERSPMYHAIALQDFLELAAICARAGEAVPPAAAGRIALMVDAFGVLSRPDGELHLFNDAARGIAPTRLHLERLAGYAVARSIAEPRGLMALPDTGYFGWADDTNGERLVVDCGEPGPRYQPGHAHCDQLHFELDVAGRSFAVDAGVHGYDGDPYREFVRSTRAHNTVVIEGREQHEVWGTFRMARRGRVLYARQTMANGYRFTGACSPYYDRRIAHHRTIERSGTGWRIVDRVTGAAGAGLSSFLHLHPEWQLEPEGGHWIARTSTAAVEVRPFGIDHASIRTGEMTPVQGWHCPEFGTALPAPALEMTVARCAGAEFGYEIHHVDG